MISNIDIWGVTPLGGGVPSIDRGSKNGDISTRFRRQRRREKFLSTFFEIFGKFVNKNAIKSDFWGVVCRYISKISKKSLISGKKYFYTRTKISKVLLQRWGHLPPKNISDKYTYFILAVIFTGYYERIVPKRF